MSPSSGWSPIITQRCGYSPLATLETPRSECGHAHRPPGLAMPRRRQARGRRATPFGRREAGVGKRFRTKTCVRRFRSRGPAGGRPRARCAWPTPRCTLGTGGGACSDAGAPGGGTEREYYRSPGLATTSPTAQRWDRSPGPGPGDQSPVPVPRCIRGLSSPRTNGTDPGTSPGTPLGFPTVQVSRKTAAPRTTHTSTHSHADTPDWAVRDKQVPWR